MSEFQFKEIFDCCERHSGSVEGKYVELQTTDSLEQNFPLVCSSNFSSASRFRIGIQGGC